MISFPDLCIWAQRFPGIVVGTAYGTPALRVRDRFLCRLRDEDGSLAIVVDPDYRELLLSTNSDAFFLTPHYEGYPMVLVRLELAEPEDVQQLLADAWRTRAPKRLIAAYDQQGPSDPTPA